MLKHATALRSNGTLSNASDLLRAIIVNGKRPMRSSSTNGSRPMASSSALSPRRPQEELQQYAFHSDPETSCEHRNPSIPVLNNHSKLELKASGSATFASSSSSTRGSPSSIDITDIPSPSHSSTSPSSHTIQTSNRRSRVPTLPSAKDPPHGSDETTAFVSQISRSRDLSSALQILDSATPAQLRGGGLVINALRDRAMRSLRAPTVEPALKENLARVADHIERLSRSWRWKANSNQSAEHRLHCWKLEIKAFRGHYIPPGALGRLQRSNALDTTPENVGRLERILEVICCILLTQQVTGRHAREALEHINAHWSFFSPNRQTDFLPCPSLANGQARAVFLEALNVARRVPLSEVRSWMTADGWKNKNHQQCLISIFVRSHCCRGQSEMALRLFNDLAERGLHLSFSLRLEVIRALLVDGLVQEASPLLAFETEALQAREVPHLQKALELAIRARNPAAQNRLRSVLAEKGTVQEISTTQMESVPILPTLGSQSSVNAVGRMTKDEKRIALLQATQAIHGARGNEAQMVEVFRQTLLQGVQPDTALCNALLSGLARREDIEGVNGMLQMMEMSGVKKDACTYTTVISMYARREDTASAEHMAKQAIDNGVRLDGRLFHALAMAYVSTESWEALIRLFEDLQDGYKYATSMSSPFVVDSLLMAYVAMGVPFATVKEFFREKLPQYGVRPSTSMYIHVIRSATDAGRLQDAMSLLQELREKAADSNSGLVMEPQAVAIVLAGFLHAGRWREAKALYAQSGTLHLAWDGASASTVLQAANRLPRRLRRRILRTLFPRALPVKKQGGAVQRLKEDDRGRGMRLERLLLPIMQTQALRQKPDAVEELHQKIIEAGGEPSHLSLCILLDAYRRVGNIAAAKAVWEQIFDKAQSEAFVHGGDPTQITRRHILAIPLSTYLDALVAAGAHGAVIKTWESVREAGFGYSPENWNTFAVALIAAGRPLEAFQAVEWCLTPANSPTPNSKAVLDESLANRVAGIRRSPQHRRRAVFEARRLKERHGEAWANALRSDDVTSPLKFISQHSGYHNRWRPSAATLMALKNVVIRLQHGHMIHPKSRRWSEEIYRGSEEDAALATLGRIQDECPLTYKKVLAPQERKRKRRDGPLRNRERQRPHTVERRARFLKILGKPSRKQNLFDPEAQSNVDM
ncbi:hypothetical protein FS837_011498 [Tulasnella sp. UAMH 9824]|nr:hypothetical protein FS837_011498 [Tulasnella sp. UAMH 9824]